MILGETIVEGVSNIGSSVNEDVQVGFGESNGRTVVQIRLKTSADSDHSIVTAVSRDAAIKLIAALALALPRLG
jgi:inosine-uridine nucleoside N-ribohydrolase